LIALKRLLTRLKGPPLFIVPLIILATAQKPIIVALNPTTVIPILEIAALLLVVDEMALVLL
jgi:hypothetical protein